MDWFQSYNSCKHVFWWVPGSSWIIQPVTIIWRNFKGHILDLLVYSMPLYWSTAPISSSSSFVNPPAPHTPSYNLAFLYSAAKFSDTFSSCSIPITIFPQSLDELCTSDNRLSILHHFDPMKTRKLKSNTLHWWVDPPRCLQRLCRTYEPTYKDIMAIGQRAVRDAGSAHPSDVISKNNNNPKI